MTNHASDKTTTALLVIDPYTTFFRKEEKSGRVSKK
jgi:hypothetical protein